MFFIPQRNRWYSWVVHQRPLYRYGLIFSIAVLVFLLWYYGLYTWLDAAIKQELAEISQLEQQCTQQLLAERTNAELLRQLPVLKSCFAQETTKCVGKNCCDQCSYIFDEAQKAGLHIIGYHTEKEKKKIAWKQSQFITLSLRGSLDQLQKFLIELKKSLRMVQCVSLSVQQAEEKMFTMSCTIQFIIPVA